MDMEYSIGGNGLQVCKDEDIESCIEYTMFKESYADLTFTNDPQQMTLMAQRIKDKIGSFRGMFIITREKTMCLKISSL